MLKLMRLKTKYLILLTLLLTTTVLTAVENKILDVSNLVRKTDHNTEINEIKNKITTDHHHAKYITTQEIIIREVLY